MDLGPRQRENLSKALYDVGKLVLAFNVLGPLATPGAIRAGWVLVGVLIAMLLFAVATSVDNGR